MSIWISLIVEFFKTGLFALGGGLATIPFLYAMIDNYGWFDETMLMNMIAISESTPGAMGVNMATYVGYHATGGSILGGIITTLSLVAPSIIVICIIAQFLKKFKDSAYVQHVFYGLRPAVAAMIASAGLGIILQVIFDGTLSLSSFIPLHFVLFLIILALSQIFKKLHPIALICLCAVLGIVLGL